MVSVRSLTRPPTKRPAFAPHQAAMLHPRRERPRVPSTGRRHPEYFQDLRAGLHSWYFALQSIAAIPGQTAKVTACPNSDVIELQENFIVIEYNKVE
jgi:hypothetical protein